MSILTWIIVGLVAGWLASVIMKGGGSGVVANIVIGILGALVGGFLGGLLFGGDYITGLNLTTILVSVLGAIVLIWLMRAIRGRSQT